MYQHLQDDLEKSAAFVVVYSVVDKSSFTHAEQMLASFMDLELLRTRAIILVANKIDLARSRAVSSQGGHYCSIPLRNYKISIYRIRRQMSGVHVSCQIHRGLRRHQSQRGRATGRHSHADQAEAGAEPDSGNVEILKINLD